MPRERSRDAMTISPVALSGPELQESEIERPPAAAAAPVPATHPNGVSGTSAAGGHSISLDQAGIAARKSDKHRRYTTIQVPALRLCGFVILSLIVAAHNWATSAVPWVFVGWTTMGFAAYSVGSWLVLLAGHGRTPFHLGTLFLGLDPFVWMGATYVTGGGDSWLYILPLIRVADQLNTSRARALAFTLDAVAAYAALLAYLVVIDGEPLHWPAFVGRMLFLAGSGCYLALTAGTAERLRAQLGQAVRTARDSIRQLQEQSVLLQDAREKAEAASRAKSQFLANVSHEFRTPLNAIIGYAELMQEEMPSPSPTVHADLDRINRSAQHLRGLVNEVIELSRVEAGRVTLDIQPVSVDTLVADVASVVTPTVRSNGNVLEITGAVETGILVADPLKVRQILVNVVGNAGKFTRDGRITLACSRERANGQEMVVFDVTDSGIGMDAEQLARILKFEPFVQADAGITRRYGGTGLGLTISQRLCRLMGGSLTITSQSGQGSTVRCQLPARVAADAGR